MVKVSEIKEPYFSHDIGTRTSKEIILIIEDLGFEGYGLFWAIVEFMHRNELKVGEERFICGKNYEAKIKSILNDYGLFHIEDDYYISNRIIRNIEEQQEKSKAGRTAVETRWLLSTYKKVYKEVFDIEPVIEDEEVQTLKRYARKIKNFKTILPDIIFTLSKIQFSNGINVKARSNWLLSEDNLGKVYNGQFGNLRSWQAEKASREPKKEEVVEEIKLPKFNDKSEAIKYIAENNTSLQFLNPKHKAVMKEFGITTKELEEYKNA